jgi:hypothetical protein
MSFGFSVGDFLTIANLAKTTREQFRDAPSEFAAISGELVTSYQSVYTIR